MACPPFSVSAEALGVIHPGRWRSCCHRTTSAMHPENDGAARGAKPHSGNAAKRFARLAARRRTSFRRLRIPCRSLLTRTDQRERTLKAAGFFRQFLFCASLSSAPAQGSESAGRRAWGLRKLRHAPGGRSGMAAERLDMPNGGIPNAAREEGRPEPLKATTPSAAAREPFPRTRPPANNRGGCGFQDGAPPAQAMHEKGGGCFRNRFAQPETGAARYWNPQAAKFRCNLIE